MESRTTTTLLVLLSLITSLSAAPPASLNYVSEGRPAGNTLYSLQFDAADMEIVISNRRSSNWPWIAMLLAKRALVWAEPVCGGSLINARHVLTAAHCVDANKIKRDTLEVHLGEFDRVTFEDGKTTKYNVTHIIVHPSYEVGASNHDLALLRLSREVQFSPSVCTIPLPSGPTGDLAGRSVSIAGWGSLFKGGSSSSVLLEVNITAFSENTCYLKYLQHNRKLDTSPNFPGGFMAHTKLCAGTIEGGKGACDGDSGGPLVERGRRLLLVGIVSTGSSGSCGSPELPTLYTRVSAYLKWIQNNANTPGIKTKTKHCKTHNADKNVSS